MSVSLYGIASYVQASKTSSLSSVRPVQSNNKQEGKTSGRFDSVHISAEGRAAMAAAKGTPEVNKTESPPSVSGDTYVSSTAGGVSYSSAIESNQEDMISSAMVALIAGAGF